MVQEQILSLIFSDEDVTWQSLLMDIVKQEGLDPFDIDISKLTRGYIQTIKKMKMANLRISGKVILASALLLKIKSKYFVEHDIEKLNQLINSVNESELNDFDDVDLLAEINDEAEEKYPLYPRTPQPRKRKVTIYDLVEALDKAMSVRERRIERRIPYARKRIELPNALDITEIIVSVYNKIIKFFNKNKQETLTFTKLLPDNERDSKVYTFIPLLHLHNERRVELRQKKSFGEIEIELLRRKKA